LHYCDAKKSHQAFITCKKQLGGGCVIGNETRLEDVVKEMKGEMKDQIRDVKISIGSSCEDANYETTLAEAVKEIKDEIAGVKNETNRVLDVLENVVNAIKNQQKNAEDVSKQALVSALVCEY